MFSVTCAYATDSLTERTCGLTGDSCNVFGSGDHCPYIDDSEGRGNGFDLKDVPTCKLVEELRKREGVESHDVPFERGYTLELDVADCYIGDGPAIVMIVTD